MNFQRDSGSFFENCEAKCALEFCSAGAFNEEHALHQGWAVIAGELYCPLHWYGARREDRKAQMRAQVEAVQREALDKTAKTGLTGREYAEWDKFQSDLADYHKKSGQLAPKPLRLMSPYLWLHYVKKNGPIDVEAEVQRMEEAQKRTTDRLKGI